MGKLKAPVVGTFRYGTMTAAEFPQKTKYPENPEVMLTGDWEGEGAGYWYANWKAVTALAQAGLLKQGPNLTDFTPAAGVRICIWQVPEGGDSKARNWFAVAHGEDGVTVVALTAFPDPVKPPAPGTTQAPQPQQGATSQPPPPGPPQSGPPTPPEQHAPPPGLKPIAEREAALQRQTLSETDAVYGLSLVVAAYQQVKFFNKPACELEPAVIQAGAATIMIRLERSGYNGKTDRRPAYFKRLRRLEHKMFPDDCPDPDAPKESPHKKGAQIPAPVSTLPCAEHAGAVTDGDEDGDDLPF